MDPKASHPPLKTWQFFSACRRILGDSWMQQLFKRGLRQLQRFSADPDFADTDRNPIDHYEAMLRRLMELGRADVAMAAVSRQAHIVGCELLCLEDVYADKASLEDELLDDYPVLVDFHQAVRSRMDPDLVRSLWSKAKRELDETFKTFEQFGNGGK